MKTLQDYLVNEMNNLSLNQFLNLNDLGYSTEQLMKVWLMYWNLSGEQRFFYDAYHFEQKILNRVKTNN